MNQKYYPTVTEAVLPDDGGWTNAGDRVVLLLSLSSFSELIHMSFETYDYAWLYDPEKDSYLFCFKLDNGEERAISFSKEYAGRLLQDKEADGLFDIAITSLPFEELQEDSDYLYLPDIRLDRHPEAGW